MIDGLLRVLELINKARERRCRVRVLTLLRGYRTARGITRLPTVQELESTVPYYCRRYTEQVLHSLQQEGLIDCGGATLADARLCWWAKAY